MQSEHDKNAVIAKQEPIISTLKPGPVPFQCVGEANSFLTVDKKIDGLGGSGFFLLPRGLVDLLREQFA